MKRLGFVLLLLALLGSAASAQASAASNTAAPQAKPYTDQEFEPWQRDLRRAEIIAVGAFPLAYLFVGLGYDYYYYLGNNFPDSNIPWPLGPGTSRWVAPAQSDQLDRKNLTLVGVSLATGVLLAAADWWLGR